MITIRSILHNNGYNKNINKEPTRKEKEETHTDPQQKDKWATFPYSEKGSMKSHEII
jgi:hypothetical protein